MTDEQSARQIAQDVAARKRSAESVVANALDRLHAADNAYQLLVALDADGTLARARDVDRRIAAGQRIGPLAGVPVAIKDNICTSFLPTTCASRILDGFRPPYDAHVVEKLRAAGAVIVAKTNLDEFAMGSSTENSALRPTRNPWDPQRVPGGSSGGSAVAVAARAVPIALGSDTGGSIRQPASLCGVCGLKPTYGRVSRYGLVAFASSLDQVGPFATDVHDLALVLSVIAGHDARDSTAVDEPLPDYAAELDRPPGKLRIGRVREHFAEGLDPPVAAAVDAAFETFRSLGAEIVDLSLPHAPYAVACYYLICTAEASSNLARYDGVHYGYRTPRPADYVDVYAASRAEGFGPEVKRRIMLGTFALSSGYHDAYYLRALRVRTLIKNDFLGAFRSCDLILGPTTPTAAFRLGEKTEDPLAMYLADIYTVSANLAGIPALSIPCGFTPDGLPIGMQLAGPLFAEARLLQAAAAYQSRTTWHTRAPASNRS
ncbi:MAG: Asp-tRNA(Asn)/Glu-tRNA(Gln) amidotransferase subunit GatA [Phycisphaerae bacterium]|nr:Asp-tRNA(Asn)/Glu-tRNA(Gln) amidotransferase subunit GatA [Phycisphaerae bacterium]